MNFIIHFLTFVENKKALSIENACKIFFSSEKFQKRKTTYSITRTSVT